MLVVEYPNPNAAFKLNLPETGELKVYCHMSIFELLALTRIILYKKLAGEYPNLSEHEWLWRVMKK
jgi:hypothetical protein